MNREDYLSCMERIGIKKEQFKNIARMIALSYPTKTVNDIPFLDSEETFNIWYEMIKEYPYLPIYLGMIDYIKSNKYPPTLADIVSYACEKYKTLLEIDRQLNVRMEQIESIMHDKGYYDFAINGDSYYTFLDFVLNDNIFKILQDADSLKWYIEDLMNKRENFIPPQDIKGWLELLEKEEGQFWKGKFQTTNC